MEDKIHAAKAALRAEAKHRLAAMTLEERNTGSAAIRTRLQSLAIWKTARSVLFFAPIAGEPDIWPLFGVALAEGKNLALPRYNPGIRGYEAREVRNSLTEVKAGFFQIREPGEDCPPLTSNVLDLILVPGLAFDPQGHRLGRGKGYYDRILASLRGLACGVAFDQQMVDDVPVAPRDHHVDCIVTPARWVTPRQPPVLE